MIKTIYALITAIVFISNSNAAYLDDWTNNDLCGWMDSSSAPEYIQTEVQKREIICYGGVEVSSLPVSGNSISKNGTVFPSPDPSLIPVITNDKDKIYSY
ncbi:transposase [Candidatus Pseudothioglobus singularis]|nr:transposase [Candidatus Pseudothioglobus singularis]